jgi:hypothetical protein
MKVDDLAEKFACIQGHPDCAYSGLRLTTEEEHSRRFLERIGTCVILVKKKYKFDSFITEQIAQSIFSTDAEIRAKAKLTISAKLETSIHREVIQDPERVLEVVMAEACLTPEEILCLLMPKAKNGEDRICVHCQTSVRIGPDTYHPLCSIVKWLIGRSHY